MKTLEQIYNENHFKEDDFTTDKGLRHSYIPIYEKYLNKYKNNSTVLEVGIYRGDSIKLWNEYFQNSKIFGIDKRIDKNIICPTNTFLFECDSTNKKNLDDIFENEMFDVIIDDGCHRLEVQYSTYLNLFPKLKKGGIYFIEDIENLDKDIFFIKKNWPNAQILDLRHERKNCLDNVMIVLEN